MIYAIFIKHAKLFSIWQYQTLREQENFTLPNLWGQNPQKKVVAQHLCAEHFVKWCFQRDLKIEQKQSLKEVSWRKYSWKTGKVFEKTCQEVHILVMLQVEGLQRY